MRVNQSSEGNVYVQVRMRKQQMATVTIALNDGSSTAINIYYLISHYKWIYINSPLDNANLERTSPLTRTVLDLA